jgi:hypothetical protein
LEIKGFLTLLIESYIDEAREMAGHPAEKQRSALSIQLSAKAKAQKKLPGSPPAHDVTPAVIAAVPFLLRVCDSGACCFFHWREEQPAQQEISNY